MSIFESFDPFSIALGLGVGMLISQLLLPKPKVISTGRPKNMSTYLLLPYLMYFVFSTKDHSHMLCSLYLSLPNFKKAVKVNPAVEKDSPKIATICQLKDIEDLVNGSEKGVKAYCRCWRSKSFPYCDGSVSATLEKIP
jgi:CDGSH-type Zn-finger protein